MACKRLVWGTLCVHREIHRRKGEIPHNFQYVPIEADDLWVESASPLYSAIFEYDRLKGASKIEYPKSCRDNTDGEIGNTVEDTLHIDAGWEDLDDEKEGEENGEGEGLKEYEDERDEMEFIINTVKDNVETSAVTTAHFREPATTLLRNDFLSKEHRTRVHEHNWGMWGTSNLKNPLTRFWLMINQRHRT